jgi:lambda family phage minor tail protein L
MSIRSDIQKLDPGARIELFELDTSMITGGAVDRFHNGVNALGTDVVWQGNTYTRFPIEASGFEWNGQGSLPRPRVKVANVSGLISAMINSLDDLVGAKLTRKRTLVKYLDAVNFPGGVNASADPGQYFDDEVWFVDRKAGENKVYVEFELAMPSDLQGVMLPRRPVIQNVCPWIAIGGYRGPYCGYTGPAVADINDNATSDPIKDNCGGRLNSCRLRFGQFNELPIGAFPGVGLVR